MLSTNQRLFQLAVFGNMYGLANMALFLMIVNYIAALVAVQLFRGDLTDGDFINFGEVWNSFLGMYQVLSSENWVDVLYGAGMAGIPLGQAVIAIIFVSAWMLFANCKSDVFPDDKNLPIGQSSCFRCLSPSSTRTSRLRKK